MELIDMQKAFVELAQGAWERIARAMDFDKKRLQKTALRQEFHPASEGEGAAAWSSSCSRNARPRKGLVRRAHSRINQAACEERGKRAWKDLLNGRVLRQVVSRLIIQRSAATILTEGLEGEITIVDPNQPPHGGLSSI